MRVFHYVTFAFFMSLAAPVSAASVTFSGTQSGVGAGTLSLALPQAPVVDIERGPLQGITWSFDLSVTISGTVQNFVDLGENTLETMILGLRLDSLLGQPASWDVIEGGEYRARVEILDSPVVLQPGETLSFSGKTGVLRLSGVVPEAELSQWVGGQTLLSGRIRTFQETINDGGLFGVADPEVNWTATLAVTYAYIPAPASGLLMGTALLMLFGAGLHRRRA